MSLSLREDETKKDYPIAIYQVINEVQRISGLVFDNVI
jgi:hypothetical protein